MRKRKWGNSFNPVLYLDKVKSLDGRPCHSKSICRKQKNASKEAKGQRKRKESSFHGRASTKGSKERVTSTFEWNWFILLHETQTLHTLFIDYNKYLCIGHKLFYIQYFDKQQSKFGHYSFWTWFFFILQLFLHAYPIL